MPMMQSNDFLKVEIPDNMFKIETSSACSTPGPSPSPAPSNMSFSAPPMRRPSRKSTLTQQQKNQKRQRATQDQLSTLEIEFSRNPTPAAVVRERIAQEINMTERSVQIWFQNRRAKIKNLTKKGIESGDDYEAIPESMRRYLAMQALESGGKPYMAGGDFFGASSGAYGSGMMLNADGGSKTMIFHLACRSLSIGSWKRIGQTQLDLVVFYSPVKSMITYYIQADGSGFRIEYPFSFIDSLTLDNGDSHDATKTGGLIIKLNRPPIFTMDQGSGGWFQCRDFTEDQQASKILTHYLGGHPKVLAGQLSKLVSLESFQHRHSPIDFTGCMPGPEIISPVIHRPSSQPNHLIHPRNQAANFATDGMFTMGPPPPRGHKRQRSRSVPVAVDFSQLRQPITPFVMHQHQHFHTHLNNSTRQPIFAPVPQHAQHHNLQQMSTPGYNLENMPALSASGTSPPSDFDSGIMTGDLSASSAYLQTPFSHNFISPIPESVDSAAETPLSAHSQSGHYNHNNMPDTSLLHLQTPCPLQRSASTGAIPQMLGGGGNNNLTLNDHYGLKTDFDPMMNNPDMYDHLNSDALLLPDDFSYDTFLSDPLADPFMDYSGADMFDTLSMPMNMQQTSSMSMSHPPSGLMDTKTSHSSSRAPPASGMFGKRHCQKQSLTLPLRLNMMEQGNVNMVKMANLSVRTPTVQISPVNENEDVFHYDGLGGDETEDELDGEEDEGDYSRITV